MNEQWLRANRPGLLELVQQEQLTDEQLQMCLEVYPTVRGRKPTTKSEWVAIWNLIKQLLEEEENAV